MSDQLYQLKSKNLAAADPNADRDGLDMGGLGLLGNAASITSPESIAERVQKDKMVELLKRNHDVMMEKYETYRVRNETLERKALEKENLYVVIKGENDNLSNSVYQLKRSVEDLRQENQLLNSKHATSSAELKTASDKATVLQQRNEQQEGQLTVVTEQLELVQKSHDQLAAKKQNEIDLLTKELNLVGVRHRDTKAQVLHLERETGETRDQLRGVSSELETRTKENDHLVSLLEDQEQRIALYEEKEKAIQ